ncbi:uncharacterized protein LOC119165344 [Rhipicephalus microplus]
MPEGGVGDVVRGTGEGAQPAMKGDKGSTLAGFAKMLASADESVFQSSENVINIFKEVDETFCDASTCVADPCTFAATYSCWAVNCQQGWNDLFNPRGAEVLQLKRGLIYFRTMDVNTEDLDSLADIKYLCLYLWFLRQHSCISAVYISLPVLAPRHLPLFLSLLKLTDGLRQCEIRGNDPFMEPSLPVCEFRLRPLSPLSKLRELGLAAVRLTNDDVNILARVVERSEMLVALVLIDVEMGSVAFADVVAKVIQHKKLQDFRVKMKAVEPETIFDEALGLIGSSGSLLRLHVHVDRGLVNLLRGLQGCTTLNELIVENMIEDAEAVRALADFLEKQQSCRCLKACINTKMLESVYRVHDDMERIIGSSSVEVLILSGSVFAPQSVKHLVDGLAASKMLKQLHLDDTQLACADVFPFVKVVKVRSKKGGFEELNLGEVSGSENELCDLLRFMTDADVCHLITLTFHERLIPALKESATNSGRFSKVTLSYVEAEQAEPALQALRLTASTLKSICIDSPQDISILGGQFLAYLIRNCKSLTVLQLRCSTQAKAARQIFKAIAQSKSLVVLSIERLCFEDKLYPDLVHRDLVDMLRQNQSLHRLEFYLRDVQEYEKLKPYLVEGLSAHEYLTSLKIYTGKVRKELVVREPVILECLRRNTIVLEWTMDIMLRDFLAPEAAAAIQALDDCESRLDLLRRVGAFFPRAAESRLRLARMATRTKYYLLRAAYHKHEEFVWSPDGQNRFRELKMFMRDQAFSIMGIAQEHRESSSDSDCDVGKS